jgi:hypothetical protein
MREDGSGFGTVHSVSTKITLNLRKSITRALHYGGTISLRTSTIPTSTIPDNEEQYPGADAEHPTAPGIAGKRVRPWRGAHQPPQLFPLAVHRRRSLALARVATIFRTQSE